MKERPNPNYEVRSIELREELRDRPELTRYLDEAWTVVANHVVDIRLLPYLQTYAPWPPPEPLDIEVARDRDEAARTVFATSNLIVSPTDSEERIEELTGAVWEEQTLFWLSQTRYDRLVADARAVNDGCAARGFAWLRLLDLPDGELRRFLTEDLPRAPALSDYQRKILCLPPR